MWCRPSPSGCAPVPVAEERLVHTCKVAVMHRSMGKGPLSSFWIKRGSRMI
ncbi:hypothetical protein HMPREF9595_00293 [Cutibacterium acnes HL005PA2]|nr:hypothetical protein HMPREF9595_00293 [Cutibacterium acnes HL005PA2]